ncbi:MAG: TRAM domain-containing protein [Actinomycetota bacterium]|nr:TRAM domain-containing protein [Actinomycetota bacterium]
MSGRTPGRSVIGRPSSPGGGPEATDDGKLSDDTVTVTIDGVAAGGDGIGRGPDGRVVFVSGALPSEVVEARVVKASKQFVRATVVDIVEPSPHRVAPPCPEVARGCGGCDWQHASPEYQPALRRAIVADALRRIGKFTVEGPDAVLIEPGPTLGATAYRTVLRAAVVDGRAGFRKERSHQMVAAERCLVAHPLAEALLIEGRYPGAGEVRIVVGARTGERMVVVSGADPEAAARARVPDDVVVVSADAVRNGSLARDGRPPFVSEEIAGRRLRISAGSFFQCRPDGAEVLVDLVVGALGEWDGTLLDAYGGVGLFSAALLDGRSGRRTVLVESNPSSAADARHNLGAGSTVVESLVERWTPEPIDVVVADPSRRGLEVGGADSLAATGASVSVLVSCDPASLARDARLLTDRGFTLEKVTVVDLFGHTSHVEAVSTFRR